MSRHMGTLASKAPVAAQLWGPGDILSLGPRAIPVGLWQLRQVQPHRKPEGCCPHALHLGLQPRLQPDLRGAWLALRATLCFKGGPKEEVALSCLFRGFCLDP